MRARSRDSLVEAMKLRKRSPRSAKHLSRGIEELFRRDMLVRRARLDKWMQLIEKEYGAA